MHIRPIHVLVLSALVTSLLPGAVVAETTLSDTIVIDPIGRPTADIALEVTRLDDRTGVDTVLIGRDDVFADALAAGVMSAPLLLVPSDGPVGADVLAELAGLDPARVVILGGEGAVGPPVADQLTEAGYEVQRRFGPTRIETAIDIAAQEAPEATTVLLARADAGPGSDDPTRAFADALAGGAWASAAGFPVLLTPTDSLAGSTRAHLQNGTITRVVILGGTAAVSAEVEAEVAGLVDTVERVAGVDRFDTATQIADARGFASADDAEHVILLEGRTAQAWAGGFAVAAHAALLDAPLLLAGGDALPAATAQWLAGDPAFAVDVDDVDGPVLTCLASDPACDQTRDTLGLPAAVPVELDPPPGAPVDPGTEVTVDVPDGTSAIVAGTCLDEPVEITGPDTITTRDDLTLPCTVTVTVTFDNGTVQTTTETYRNPTLDTGAAFQQLSIRADGEPSQEHVGDENVAISASGNTAVFASGNPHLIDADDPLNGFFQVYRRRLDGLGQELLTRGIDGAEGDFHSYQPTVSADGSRVLFSSEASNLVADDTNDARDVFLWDQGAIRAVSTLPGSDELLPSGGEVPVISDDGRWAVLRTFGGFMPGADPSDTDGLVLVNLDTDERVLVDPAGSLAHDLSADGRFVVYESPEGIKRFDRDSGATEVVSVGPDGSADTAARQPSVSTDGSSVLFTSTTDLVGDGQGSAGPDVYLAEASGDVRRVNPAGVTPGGPLDISGAVALAGDGSAYAMATRQDIDEAGDDWVDTFVVELADGGTTRVSAAPGDPGGDTFVGGQQGMSGSADRLVLLTNGFDLPLFPGIEELPGIDPALHAVGAAVG